MINVLNSRISRFVVATIALLFAGSGLVEFSVHYFDTNRIWTWIIYVAYLVIQAVLLAALAAALNATGKLKFSISSLLIMTTIVALPMGTSAALKGLLKATTTDLQTKRGELDEYSIIIFVALYAALIPLVLFAEAVVCWVLAKKRRG